MSEWRGVGLDKRQARRSRRRAELGSDRYRLMLALTGRRYLTRAQKVSMDAARKRADRLIEQPCSEGACTEFIDPETGENTGGWGPVGCPCQDEGGVA